MPTLRVSHMVDSTDVSIGILSGPGGNLPKFVFREFLDSALKALQQSMIDQLNSVKRLLKGKEKAEKNANTTSSTTSTQTVRRFIGG